MLSSIFTVSLAQSAIELGCIYALVALALFVSFSILNIADLSTDGCFTLGCAVCAMVTLQGHPFLGLLAATGAGVISGFVTAFLQTRLGVESILAGIIVNTGSQNLTNCTDTCQTNSKSKSHTDTIKDRRKNRVL